MKIQIVNKSNNPLPQYQTKGAVGFDLQANEDWNLIPNEVALVQTGLYIAIPEGFEGQIRPRSGLAINNGITVLNSPGTIDSDYRGEIKIMLYNTSEESFAISKGDRIAQLVISPIQKVELEEVEELDSTERGEGGFGSTGINEDLVDIYEDEIPIDYDYVEEQEDL